jgi:regulator of protease activity HflC (stomatin/prohibitin superfamily)
MITTLIIIISLIVAVGVAISTRSKAVITTQNRYKEAEQTLNTRWLVTPIMILVVGLLVGFVQPYSLERVDASGVGFKVHLTGGERGISNYEYKTGWVTYNTWTDQFVEIATSQQHIEYDTISVITKGGFMAKITPSFNYAVVPDSAADMYVKLRKTLPEIEQGWLKNAIYSSVNDVANKWAVDSIFNWREQFEAAIVFECNKRVSAWFKVSQLRSNIIPPPALQASIIAKTNAIQEVQVAENKKNVAIAEALTNVATAEGLAKAQIAKARGDSAEAVINANGQAEAIRIQQRQLTPIYVDWIKASSWDGKLPTTILSGGVPMINLK